MSKVCGISVNECRRLAVSRIHSQRMETGSRIYYHLKRIHVWSKRNPSDKAAGYKCFKWKL